MPPPTQDEGGLPQLDALPDFTRSMELVRAYQGGRGEALDELFRRYAPRLRRVLRVRMGAKLLQRVDLEDVLQDVYIVALRKIGELELRGPSSILHWLRALAENVIRSQASYHSAQRRNPERVVSLEPGPEESRPAPELEAKQETPSKLVGDEEDRALVDAYLADLTPTDYRDVILYRDYYSDSWEDVRARLGRGTVPATQELYRRALAKLRERMRKHLEP